MTIVTLSGVADGLGLAARTICSYLRVPLAHSEACHQILSTTDLEIFCVPGAVNPPGGAISEIPLGADRRQ